MIDGDPFSNLAEPERISLPERAEVEQDIRNIVGDADAGLIEKLVDYVEASVAEATLIRHPSVSGFRLPTELVSVIQAIDSSETGESRPGDSD